MKYGYLQLVLVVLEIFDDLKKENKKGKLIDLLDKKATLFCHLKSFLMF